MVIPYAGIYRSIPVYLIAKLRGILCKCGLYRYIRIPIYGYIPVYIGIGLADIPIYVNPYK